MVWPILLPRVARYAWVVIGACCATLIGWSYRVDDEPVLCAFGRSTTYVVGEGWLIRPVF